MPGNFVLTVLVLGLIVVSHGGCGQKGALYLPPPQPDQTQEKR